MGQWNITIRGTGCHHNKAYPQDANLLAATFVEQLKAAGHTIVGASFTYGGDEEITDGKAYIEAREQASKDRP